MQVDRNVQQGELVGGRGRGRGRSKLIKLSTGGDVCGGSGWGTERGGIDSVSINRYFPCFGSVPKLLGVGEPQEVNFLCCVEPSFWVVLYP